MLDNILIPAIEKDSKRLWIMMHGLGDSVEGYRWMPQVMELPSVNYLLVNAPDDYFGGYSWFDFAGDMQPGVQRSRQLLFELLDAQREAGFPSESTILGGFSQGCLMAMDVGLRYPHKLAGIVGISGWIWEPTRLLSEKAPHAADLRILMTHGTQDPMVPFASVKQQVAELKSAGLPIQWHEFHKAHTIEGESEIKVIRGFVSQALGIANG
jgi:phospholipase/carboxylesterase